MGPGGLEGPSGFKPEGSGPGATVAVVVPAGDRMIIEAKLPIQDIVYVHPGQTALVTLAS